LVGWFTLTSSRSTSKVVVIGQTSRSQDENLFSAVDARTETTHAFQIARGQYQICTQQLLSDINSDVKYIKH